MKINYHPKLKELAEKDALKQERLKALGITVLRFCDEDVMKNTEGFYQQFDALLNIMKNGRNTPPTPLFSGESSNAEVDARNIIFVRQR